MWLWARKLTHLAQCMRHRRQLHQIQVLTESGEDVVDTEYVINTIVIILMMIRY